MKYKFFVIGAGRKDAKGGIVAKTYKTVIVQADAAAHEAFFEARKAWHNHIEPDASGNAIEVTDGTEEDRAALNAAKGTVRAMNLTLKEGLAKLFGWPVGSIRIDYIEDGQERQLDASGNAAFMEYTPAKDRAFDFEVYDVKTLERAHAVFRLTWKEAELVLKWSKPIEEGGKERYFTDQATDLMREYRRKAARQLHWDYNLTDIVYFVEVGK